MRKPLKYLIGIVSIGIMFGVVKYLMLPTTNLPLDNVSISEEERAALLLALQPPKRSRPIIAVIGSNDGAETTDYLIPYAVLKRANIAEVFALGTRQGSINLMPALTIIPDASIADFDSLQPDGADYVIVPAMHNYNDPATVMWIKQQAAKGAIIVGICAGTKVLGNAGLLDGRTATSHWYELEAIHKDNPSMHYVQDRRYLVDRGVATTTGVTASIPMSLTLVEAIAGSKRAAEVALELGVENWDARHSSNAFRATRSFYKTGIINTLAFWRKEKLEIEIESGVDEIALALTSDAWSRTYRSSALTVTRADGVVMTKGGIGILPDRITKQSNKQYALPSIATDFPAKSLESTLSQITDRYGLETASFVALQLEYPTVKRLQE